MRLQLLSDLHLETENFDPVPTPGAELLVLAGDIDSSWVGFERFRAWPVPVILIAGNHEFDGREITQAWPELRALCERLDITLMECEDRTLVDSAGRRIRLLGTTRWCDFELFGAAQLDRSMRAGNYFMRVMRSTVQGEPFGPDAVRRTALACRAWLERELRQPDGNWDATVVVTHFAPSLRSADPRYGHQAGTASFCNADDDLFPHADLWIHGHLHCRHDYRVGHAAGSTRVVSNARGHSVRGEVEGHEPTWTVDV
jgi:DNA repair exonuclease SbcCD nuclease subunit